MIVHESSGAGEGDSDFFGPARIDQLVRQAVEFCWGALPKERRAFEELEKQVQRLVDRALRDFRDDREAFGK